ncbi:MAG TPA: glutamate synthase-related protein, partial [Thermoleophilia bacterium]|nr:glutamate synthase-related protein [Thermoleophilia bacterium]
SPDPKHDIYSIEDMPAEVWLWLLYRTYCGIKITGSNYTRFVAAGMWSNFVVDYLLIDAGTGGSGNYHGDSAHVGWPDAFRTILHTHHALMGERVDLDGSGQVVPIRDGNGAVYGAAGGTRLLASGGLRGELDMLKVLIAGADGLVEGTIGKAAAFGCTQCGNCHLDCPRGGITTKQELTVQNDRGLMRRRMRNWTALNMIKLAVLLDALNRESGALDEAGAVARPDLLLDDIRLLRGRTDLLEMPLWPAGDDGDEAAASRATAVDGAVTDGAVSSSEAVPGSAAPAAAAVPAVPAADAAVPAADHDSCRVGSLAVSEPVTVDAIWEAARRSFNGGNNRGGGIDFAGFAPPAVRDLTAVMLNTIGPDRRETLPAMLTHFAGCRFVDAAGAELDIGDVLDRLDEFVVPVRERYRGAEGWRRADLREDPGDFALFFVDVRPDVLARYGRRLLAGERWLQRETKYAGVTDDVLAAALEMLEPRGDDGRADGRDGDHEDRSGSGRRQARDSGREPCDPAREPCDPALAARFVADVREEYFSVLAHLLDSRYYRTHDDPGRPAPAGKYSAKRRGYVVSMGQDLGALKISGWTHTIPEYFDLSRFWERYPGAAAGNGAGPALRAHVWGMHHRYPTNSPALDAEGRGNPAGAHPFKAYNVLLMHNGEQVGVDSTSPFLREYGYVHADESMGEGAALYEGDSLYDRKALTDTEYAAYLIDFTRRVLGLTTEEASQIVSPITGIDLAAIEPERRRRLELLGRNYVQLTPTGPYKFTIVESRPGEGVDDSVSATTAGSGPATAAVVPPRRVGFRENMDIKFLRPHELVVSADTGPGGVQAVANGSEAKIADAMLRELHRQDVLADAGHDLRFSMRPGGNPGRGEFGGVVEAFLTPGAAAGAGGLTLVNRFGEPVVAERGGRKASLARPLRAESVTPAWRSFVDEGLAAIALELPPALAAADRERRFLGPDEALPQAAARLVDETLARLATPSHDDYRYLVEEALPAFGAGGDAARACALRVLAELRKRVALCDLGDKALSSIEYLTDGGRDADGRPEGGIARLLDAVPTLPETLASGAGRAAAGSPPAQRAAGGGLWARLTADTRDDLLPPSDPARDVLVVDLAGFESEAFGLSCASRFVSEAVRLGWRNLVGFGCLGGPRYLGANLADDDGTPARGVVVELFGRESGDFLGALLEGAEIWLYGQAQCHVGMKADSGYLFVLQDGLNTCFYAAHGGTLSLWDSGSRFAVAGQNKVMLADGLTPAPGLKSIHFGSPNEYAFEYLMSGGENSLHVVMGLAKPDARGELALRPRPYAGKFFMSGAAAGRVLVFDPQRALEPAQYHGNVVCEIVPEEWRDLIAPFIAAEARKRGLPLRIEGEELVVRLGGEWRRFRYDEAFLQLIPQKVARKLAKQGVTPPQLEQIVGE